jgi:hypothetical protein
MITTRDSPNTIDLGNYFAILGSGLQQNVPMYLDMLKAKLVPAGFAYESGTNPKFLSVEQIRTLIKTHMDENFIPI